MAKSRRKRFSREFKLRAVERVNQGELPADVANSLHVHRNQIYKWKEKFAAANGSQPPKPRALEEQTERLLDMIYLKNENDLLKRVVASLLKDYAA